MAISALVAVDPIADELVAKIAERTRTLRVGDGTARLRHGPAGHRGAPRQGGRLHRRRRGRRRHRSSWTAARSPPDADGEGFLLGPDPDRPRHPRDAIYTDEIFGPVLSVVRVETYDEGWR